jgi:hypothetical protein
VGRHSDGHAVAKHGSSYHNASEGNERRRRTLQIAAGGSPVPTRVALSKYLVPDTDSVWAAGIAAYLRDTDSRVRQLLFVLLFQILTRACLRMEGSSLLSMESLCASATPAPGRVGYADIGNLRVSVHARQILQPCARARACARVCCVNVRACVHVTLRLHQLAYRFANRGAHGPA